jgi:hypothetical protein
MFDTFMGLPVHALVMHAVVVLVPLSALGVVAIAVVPRWRERFGVLVVLLSTAGLAFVPVATRSGAALKARINAGGVTAEQIDRHQQMGNLVLWPTLAMWVLAVALVVMSRGGRRRGAGVTLVAVLAVLGAGTSAVLVTLTGHLGSTAVWSCTIGSEACK